MVADKCTDGTPELLRRSQPSVLVIETEGQSWCHGSRTLGARHASGSIVFCLDDDNIVASRCLELLVDAMQAHPDFAVIAAVTVAATNPEIVWHRGVRVTYSGRARAIDRGLMVRHLRQPNVVLPVDMTPNAFAIRAEHSEAALAEVARFLPHNWSEWGMCFAIRQRGFKAGCLASAVVVHDNDRAAGLLTHLDIATVRDQSRSRIVARRMIRPSVGHALAYWAFNFPASLAIYGYHIARGPRRRRLLREFVVGLFEGIVITVPEATTWTQSSSDQTTRRKRISRASHVPGTPSGLISRK